MTDRQWYAILATCAVAALGYSYYNEKRVAPKPQAAAHSPGNRCAEAAQFNYNKAVAALYQATAATPHLLAEAEINRRRLQESFCGEFAACMVPTLDAAVASMVFMSCLKNEARSDADLGPED